VNIKLPPKRVRKPIWMSKPSDDPDFVQKLANKEDFKETFYMLAREFPTNLEAYEHLEKLRVKYFGSKLFDDYESFRIAMIE